MCDCSEEDVTFRRKRNVYVDTDLSDTDNESKFSSYDYHYIAVILFAHDDFSLGELCTTVVKVERKESVKDDEGNEDGDSLMSDWSTSINVKSEKNEFSSDVSGMWWR